MKKAPQEAGRESGARGGDSSKKADGAGGSPAGQSAPPPGPGSFDWWRENIEALLVAVILALIIRHFAVEAFEIPTGSMANTLFGIHAWLDCPNCHTEFNVALGSDPSSGNVNVPYSEQLIYKGRCVNPACSLELHFRSRNGAPLRAVGEEIQCTSCQTTFRGDPKGYVKSPVVTRRARCPLCHHVYEAVLERRNMTGGHKILVNKFAYALGKPERFDVIVFGFDQWKNYIKRLIGLPGERINVWDGDVYVNGQIVRKSDHRYAQDALWTKISDSDVLENGLNKVPAWSEVAPDKAARPLTAQKNAEWDSHASRWSLNASSDVAVLEYERHFDNYYNYNICLYEERGVPPFPPTDRTQIPEQVGDKKVDFTVEVATSAPRQGTGTAVGSWIGAELRDGEFTFQLRIPVGKPSEANPAVLERVQPSPTGAIALKTTAQASIPLGVASRVELENADDRILAKLNGQEILRIDYRSLPEGATLDNPPTPPSQMSDAHALRLVVCGAQATLRSVRVFRDMFYISQVDRAPWRGITLGEGQYFAMGDNAPSSSDGRYWGFIPEKNLMGKALLVFWPAWPTNFQWKFIR